MSSPILPRSPPAVDDLSEIKKQFDTISLDAGSTDATASPSSTPPSKAVTDKKNKNKGGKAKVPSVPVPDVVIPWENYNHELLDSLGYKTKTITIDEKKGDIKVADINKSIKVLTKEDNSLLFFPSTAVSGDVIDDFQSLQPLRKCPIRKCTYFGAFFVKDLFQNVMSKASKVFADDTWVPVASPHVTFEFLAGSKNGGMSEAQAAVISRPFSVEITHLVMTEGTLFLLVKPHDPQRDVELVQNLYKNKNAPMHITLATRGKGKPVDSGLMANFLHSREGEDNTPGWMAPKQDDFNIVDGTWRHFVERMDDGLIKTSQMRFTSTIPEDGVKVVDTKVEAWSISMHPFETNDDKSHILHGAFACVY